MNIRAFLSGKAATLGHDDDLYEWARHHDDPRSDQGMALMAEAQGKLELTDDELFAMWKLANKLVGQRAPADYGEFLAYGYFEGRRDALRRTV